MALANITNNILTDSGILVTNLTPTSRTLTINGVTYDLSADRSWSIATHDAVTIGTANGLSLSGQVLSLGLASGSANGALSSTDWTTFNNKQNALTNPVTGTGTTNYLPKFTGASTIGNSALQETSGNLGLGVTPSAWGNAAGFLAFEMPSGNINSYGTDWLIIGQNSYSNSSGTRIYKNTGFASEYIQTSSQHIWRIAPSGTAGNAISFTQAMTLNASGNLGIGSTSPASKLSVGGDGYAGRAITATANNADFGVTIRQDNASGAGLQIFTTQTSWGSSPLVIANSVSNLLTIASTGAATFSSTLGINGVSDNIKSGTYTPTITLVTNAASSTAYVAQFSRVGNVVTVSGVVTVAATVALTNTRITMSLPINSNFDFSYRAGGGGGGRATSIVCVISASGSASTSQMDFVPTTTGSIDYFFSYTYQIL